MKSLFELSTARVHWYPSHMERAMRLMEKLLKRVDVVLEVRDARIPFSSTNPLLERLCCKRDKIIIFNKTDLSDPNANLV